MIEGAITVHVGDERFEAKRGDYVFAPMGVPHAFIVTSEQVELLVTFAGAGTEGPLGAGVHGFFSEVGTPVAADIEPPQPQMPDVAEFAPPDGRLRDRARRAAAGKLSERTSSGRVARGPARLPAAPAAF